ncbi:aminoglycoside resistance protein [Mycobacterium hodleri]|uniref:aminoglycoside phosphotransferase family protein n=1 Tax=Mycolicibacterium hodleri TaxID=49897 RepID=UPI0021F337B0|nr:aminoglycoside phosphotransferase family protein [Mycolicibacterium hodleri]MCV7133376.1 aminoglycoside resistance protein [Mycolicibacterium hodleri]
MTDVPPGIRGQLDEWELTSDGPVTRGSTSAVMFVRTSDGAPAVLKIASAAAGSEHEHLVLRRWGGVGAVRLLRADPHRHALLLERLDPQNLDAMWDVEACEVVAAQYRHLHVSAMPQLRSLTTEVEQWVRDFEELPRSAPVPRRLVEQAIVAGRELTSHPDDGAVVLHGDLHYGKVLAARREPWLAIGPRPINGDPHFEIAPMLWHRWDELDGNVRTGVRMRFDALVDAAGFDEARARSWVLVRVVHQVVRLLAGETSVGSDELTKYVAIAKAVQG